MAEYTVSADVPVDEVTHGELMVGDVTVTEPRGNGRRGAGELSEVQVLGPNVTLEFSKGRRNTIMGAIMPVLIVARNYLPQLVGEWTD